MQRKLTKSIALKIFYLGLIQLMPTLVAASLFSVPPYITINHQGELIAKFKLSQAGALSVLVHEKNSQGLLSERNKIEGNYRSGEVQDINLGKVDCGIALVYSFAPKGSSRVEGELLSNEIPAVPCDSSGPLVFGFLADTQENVGHPQLAKVIMGLLPQNMHFIINGGDVVNFGAQPSEWVNHFAVANTYYAKLPVVAAVGNHEYWSSWTKNGTLNLFRDYMRTQGDSPTGEIRLRFPQVDILVFNSNFKWVSQTEQWQWLEQSLKEAREQGKKVIVVMHHSPFTSGKDKGSFRGRTLRDELVPMLEKSGNVILVLSGHEHIYERSLKNGIQYVVAGPAGGGHYAAVSSNPYRQYVNDKARTFTLVKLASKTLELATYNNDNTLIDRIKVPFN